MRTETLLRVQVCTEYARNCQGSSANSGHGQTIKNARSSDQDRILDDQDVDPGRGRFHRRVLGDYPLTYMFHYLGTIIKPSYSSQTMTLSLSNLKQH